MSLEIITYPMAVAAFVATIANVYKQRWCFAVWLVTNSFWAAYDLSIGAYAQAGLFAAYAVLAVLGLYQWSKKEVK